MLVISYFHKLASSRCYSYYHVLCALQFLMNGLQQARVILERSLLTQVTLLSVTVTSVHRMNT